jgi:hypothetical protein
MNTPTLIPLLSFTRQLGRTAPTIWRWRKNGMLDGIINIAGRPYITEEGMEKFHRRARAGEFSRPDHAPKRSKAVLS